jgi:hypothetical protein
MIYDLKAQQRLPCGLRPMTYSARGPAVQTKPIPDHQNTHHFTILLFHHPDPMSIVQNEPNLPRNQGTDTRSPARAPAAPGTGQLCKTNPIRTGRLGPRGPIVQNKPSFSAGTGGMGPVGWVNRAKQTQFPPERRDEQVLCKKGGAVNGVCREAWRNKANSSALIGIHAGQEGHRRDCHQGHACKTKPIPGGRAEAMDVESATVWWLHPFAKWRKKNAIMYCRGTTVRR